ncbi:MAG: hypothetical protein K2L67_00010 [Clostridia bacterium]|nr:hypothetical protein [Clostridia bacterium]
MAEERLIDDDKDKKYKIRKNEKGEDELYLSEESEEGEEEVTFEIPEFETDDEEAALMTPEQLAAREKMREEEARRRAEKIANAISGSQTAMEEGNFEAARYLLSEAAEIDGENGEIRFLQLKALTQNFTDYTLAEEAAEVAKAVKEHCTAEQKAALNELSAPLAEKLAQAEKNLTALGEENETKKAERRKVFAAKRKKSLVFFSATAIPLVIFAIITAIIGSMMHSRQDGLLVIITIVFGALTAVAFIATVVASHFLWQASQKVKRNEINRNTRLGREYEAKKSELEALTSISNSLSA